jgi:hypothetical protein
MSRPQSCSRVPGRTPNDTLKGLVKSRYQTDCDRAFPVKERTFAAFDFLIIAFLNIGYFYRQRPAREGLCDPEFYTLPRDFIKEHHRVVASGWEKVKTKHLDLEPFKNELGFDLIAAALGVPYPSRPSA